MWCRKNGRNGFLRYMVLDTPNKSRGNFMTHVRAVFCCVSKMELGLLIATPHGHIICQPAAWLRHPLIIHISYGCWLKQWETKGWSYVRSAWTVTSAIFFGGKTLVSLKFLKCDLGHRCTFFNWCVPGCLWWSKQTFLNEAHHLHHHRYCDHPVPSANVPCLQNAVFLI